MEAFLKRFAQKSNFFHKKIVDFINRRLYN